MNENSSQRNASTAEPEDSGIEILTIPWTTPQTELTFYFKCFKGNHFLDIRVKENGSFTRKGLAVAPVRLDAFEPAIIKAMKEARRLAEEL